MLTDDQIRAAHDAKEILLEPFDNSKIEPASYDMRVGERAFSSKSKEIELLGERLMLTLEPGEFAVVECRERVRLDNSHVAQLGLRSEYAHQGLLLLSGPQIDPGWPGIEGGVPPSTGGGIIKVRVVNLAPRRIPLLYNAPFVTLQFFQLSEPASKPYSGPHTGEGITAKDIQELSNFEGVTLGQMMRTLSALADDVGQLRTYFKWLTISIPVIVFLGMILVAMIVFFKH